jgi:uncharacterized protein (TIRG00374 family)
MSHQSKNRWKVILNVITFVGFVVLIYAVRHQITNSFHTIGHIRWWWLLLLPLWQILNYDAYARQNRDLFAVLGSTVSYKFLLKVNLELNFVNHIFPSGGVSGFSYFSLRLKEKNISGVQASLVQLLRFVLVYVSFLALLIVALIMLSFNGRVNGLVMLVGGSISTLIVIGTIGMAFIVDSQKRINAFFGFLTKVINRIIHVVRPKHPETINVARAREAFDSLHQNYSLIKKDYTVLKRPLVWSLMANITEIVTLYTVYLAFGHVVNPGAIILAYAIANLAGFLSVLPSGVGVYEALMTAVLALGGVSPAISIPVTVMYRVLSMAIQLLPGYYFYYHRMRTTEQTP